MTLKAIFLTDKESRNPLNLGYKFVKENPGRIEPLPIQEDHLVEYEAARSYIVKNDKVYNIIKDFFLLDQNVRLYILQNIPKESDIVD